MRAAQLRLIPAYTNNRALLHCSGSDDNLYRKENYSCALRASCRCRAIIRVTTARTLLTLDRHTCTRSPPPPPPLRITPIIALGNDAAHARRHSRFAFFFFLGAG